MPEEIPKEKGTISRREFLKDAGLIVGGATLGSVALASACGGTTTVTGPTVTSTKTVTSTVTSTVAGPGGSVVTVTSPGSGSTATVTKTVTATGPGGATVTNVVETRPEGYVTLKVNGENYELKIEPHWSLGFVLRDKLGLMGTKISCDRGECS